MSSRQSPTDRKSVRERAAAARAAQLAAERRRDRIIRSVIVVVVVAVVAGIGLGVYIASRSSDTTAAASGGVPRGVSGTGGGVPYGPASGVPVLDIWEDFQCPACKAFEATAGSTVKQLTDAGKVRVVYHPLSFLDANLRNDSSARAAAASGCAANQGKFREFHDVIYPKQPAQEGVGYTDAQLLDFGKEAGLTGAAYDTYAGCVEAKTFAGWVQQVQNTMADAQVTSTPTLVLDGKKLPASAYTEGNAFSGAALAKTIEAAAKG